MKYIYLKKVNNVNLNFNSKKFYLINNILNINFSFFLYYNFFYLQKGIHKYLFFKTFLDRAKFINLLKKSFLSITRGFCIHLDLIGLGYSVIVKIKKNLVRFNIGFNHSVYYNIPKNVIMRSKRKRLYLFSYSFFSLKNAVVDIKNFRKLSIYKLKGIKVKNELYVKKN